MDSSVFGLGLLGVAVQALAISDSIDKWLFMKNNKIMNIHQQHPQAEMPTGVTGGDGGGKAAGPLDQP